MTTLPQNIPPTKFAPVQVGLIGAGGYAAYHLGILRQLEEEGWCRLCACAEPNQELLIQTAQEQDFTGRGVSTYASHRDLLAAQAASLDFVIVPTPLPLHAGMHRDCVEAVVACYLEKPPSLYLPELEEMIAVEQAAVVPTQVGFNFRDDPARLRIKQLACGGELGKMQQAKLQVLWRREASYYTRNQWNGRLFLGDRPVLDSCIGNATSHFLNLLLWHAGTESMAHFAAPAQVQAELYRAHEIDSFDTAFLRGKTSTAVDFYLAVSHACEEKLFNEETYEFERATVWWVQDQGGEIVWKNGETERLEPCPEPSLIRSLRHYMRLLRGELEAPLQTLTDCRPFVQLISLALLSCPRIQTVRRESYAEPEASLIPGVDEITSDLLPTMRLPSEAGVGWAGSSQLVDRAALSHLVETIESMKTTTVPMGA